jgi:hypothetical protein
MNAKIYKIIENDTEYTVYEYEDEKHWRLNDLFHRENGPAIEANDGYKVWYKHGFIHRTDGPAIIYSSGIEEYWLNGIHYPDVNSHEELLLLASIIT